jgi:hypothetical protein
MNPIHTFTSFFSQIHSNITFPSTRWTKVHGEEICGCFRLVVSRFQEREIHLRRRKQEMHIAFWWESHLELDHWEHTDKEGREEDSVKNDFGNRA